MPRYYFHIEEDGQTTVDPQGVEPPPPNVVGCRRSCNPGRRGVLGLARATVVVHIPAREGACEAALPGPLQSQPWHPPIRPCLANPVGSDTSPVRARGPHSRVNGKTTATLRVSVSKSSSASFWASKISPRGRSPLGEKQSLATRWPFGPSCTTFSEWRS